MQLIHPTVFQFHHSVATVTESSPLWCQVINKYLSVLDSNNTEASLLQSNPGFKENFHMSQAPLE